MGWVVNATPRPLYPREIPGTHFVEGFVVPRTGLDRWGKSRPNRDTIPDRSTRSKPLYRLRYPGPMCNKSDGFLVICDIIVKKNLRLDSLGGNNKH
jgi:hypothetical protein